MKRLGAWGWVAGVAVAALLIAILSWLVVGALVGRGVAIWGLLLSFAIIVLAALADWFTREDKSGATGWARLRSPRWLARLGMSIFFGLGMGLFAQQFVAPTEFDLVRKLLGDLKAGQQSILAGQAVLRDGQAQADRKLDTVIRQTAPRPWRAFDEIDGLWGEAQYDCRVVYRFERRDHALTVTLAKKDPGMSDYRMIASLAQTGQGDRLDAVLRSSTAEDETDGQALVFTYFDDGAVKRLAWLNETRSRVETRLEWCGEAP